MHAVDSRSCTKFPLQGLGQVRKCPDSIRTGLVPIHTSQNLWIRTGFRILPHLSYVVLHPDLKTLRRIRKNQQKLLYGGGLITTLVAFFILAMGVKVGIGACMETQRRAFALGRDLVSRYGLTALRDPFLVSGTHGMALLLSADGQILASAGDCCDQGGDQFTEILRLVVGKAEIREQEASQDGMWAIFQRLPQTEHTLVMVYGWRSIVAGANEHIGVDIMLTLPTVIMIWLLLISLKLRAFRPLMEWARRVYESENLSRILIDTAPVGLGLIAAESGRPLLRSPAMSAITLRIAPNENALPQACVRLHRERFSGGHRQSRRVVNEDLRFETKDGANVVLSVSMVAARYQGNDVLVTAFTDVTAKRRVERQLRKARRAADMANAAKSAFLAAMSHEIRTPLNAILGNLELLAHSPLNSEQKGRLNTIRGSSNGLLTIVGDVLDFSKIEAGELTLESLEYDAHEVAVRALSIFAPVAQSKGLSLVADLGDVVSLPVRGDPTRLGQIIQNLISNAVKFTDRGGVVLKMWVDEQDAALGVSVTDTGIGMSPEQRARLFRAFSQSDPTISRRFGGTGLGLALCQRLAQAMGGTISVRTALWQGSTFTLRLPLGRAPRVDCVPCFEGEKVVLLAASDAWRDCISRCLRAWGLQVSAHADPADVAGNAMADASVLILWGGHRPWSAQAENQLVEESAWVIDSMEDGPAEFVERSRVLVISTYGLKTLALALRHVLLDAPLSRSEMRRPLLAKRLKVLVAEDCDVNRSLLLEQLRMLGCDGTAMANGETALLALREDHFDVLLTDLTMPVMDGHLLKKRASQALPGLIVIAMTAHVTTQERLRCEKEGFAQVLEKPLLLTKLGAALAAATGVELLDQARPDEPAASGESAMVEALKPLFMESCRASLNALREARQGGDVPRILAELHKLRGLLAVYGLHEIAEKAAKTHGKLCESSTMDAAKPTLEVLEDALATILERRRPNASDGDGLEGSTGWRETR